MRSGVRWQGLWSIGAVSGQSGKLCGGRLSVADEISGTGSRRFVLVGSPAASTNGLILPGGSANGNQALRAVSAWMS